MFYTLVRSDVWGAEGLKDLASVALLTGGVTRGGTQTEGAVESFLFGGSL